MTTQHRITAGDGDHRHATINGYQNLKCRCPECRAAWSRWIMQTRARRAAAIALGSPLPPTRQHGTYGTYNNYGCRCVPCREAARAERARHRAATA